MFQIWDGGDNCLLVKDNYIWTDHDGVCWKLSSCHHDLSLKEPTIELLLKVQPGKGNKEALKEAFMELLKD